MVQTVEELTRSIRVKTFLGAGGFAWVFQGVYQATAVAVKLALAPKNTDEARYCREAVLAQQLRHPHVVATYLARGITLSKDMVDDIYGRPSDASAADGGAASSSTATPRVPGALTMLPNFPSAKSDDGMGNPRVGQQPMSAAAQEAGGWPQALCNMGVLPDQILMVMVQELCDGGNLAGALKRGTFRPQGKTSLLAARRMLVRTAAEICRGMLHLHNANVIHGDLKPANVLLTRTRNDRRGFTAKVADFGLSKLLHDDTSHVLSDNVGTVAYSSPEAIQGKHSKTCDVWSFGILLWQLVAQDRPFSKLTPAQIMMGVGFNNLKPTWPPEVWPELCALGERCLASNPVDRPGFEELEEALVVLEEGLREESKRVSMEQRAAAAAAAAAGMASGGAAGVVPAAAGTSVAAAAAAAHTARPGAAFAT
ncbi:hypothetical protein HXX76_009126 [Chlamydomonas incerta]|uniref:Protein kinase domain-containing protein n=1 Tax=Chlamydomonas incerta TaxID=51695 RepID=A0A835VWR7_CHLIN|nr:hypothetical protein HXX76_009126 [Chlamydomonas incerta]|eukprot:KAG2432207.1 hypothetical protein HXX76_009126 [Chlamydomonas incerta]